jgi:isopenicillin N synthase-like dioxygenase
MTNPQMRSCQELKGPKLICGFTLASHSASLLSAFHYEESADKQLHCAAHVDKGLLSIVLNPKGLEVLVEGQWVRADLTRSGEALEEGYAVVLVGHTLEKATRGLCEAAFHRVQYTGAARVQLSRFVLIWTQNLISSGLQGVYKT